MRKHKVNLWFLRNNKGFADAGGDDDKDKDKGGDDKNKGGEETVSKAEFDKLQATHDKAVKDLDDVRMEVLTDDYMKFLEDKGKGGDADDKDKAGAATDTTITDEEFSKMTPKQVYEKAKTDAIAAMKGHSETATADALKKDKDAKAVEVARFKRSHEDYDTYRPTMYGLAIDPKNADLSLQELYDMAKDNVKRIHTGASEKEKEDAKNAGGEKPDGDSDSVERLKKLDEKEASAEAMAEVKDKLGPIPSS